MGPLVLLLLLSVLLVLFVLADLSLLLSIRLAGGLNQGYISA